MSEQHHTTYYGTTKIPFVLTRKARKTLAIEVHPDSSVRVIAPMNASLEAICERVQARGRWIVKQQAQYRAYPTPLPERRYYSGEGYRYLGKQYRLKVQTGEREGVRLWHGRLEVTTTDSEDSSKVRRLLVGWMRQRAQVVFQERLEACVRLASTCYDLPDAPVTFSLRTMPQRWGSCTKDGAILLNPILVSAPKACIDYVIMHELCHRVHHNHSPQFFALLTRCMPDWEARKARLNRTVEAFDF